MARIFKHKYADGHRSPKFYIEYTAYDEQGQPYRKRVVGLIDRKATEHLAADLEREAERVKVGLIPAQAKQLKSPLADHIEEWSKSIAARTSASFAQRRKHQLAVVADGCGWTFLRDLDAEQAQNFLANYAPKGKRKIGAQQVVHYIKALRSFGAWCIPARLAVNPFTAMSCPQISADRRHVRRALTAEELQRLIVTTRARADSKHALPPVDRSYLYLIASHSGLRALELSHLQAHDIDLKAQTVSLSGELTKNGKDACIPIPEWLATELRPWLKLRIGLLWPSNWAKGGHAAKMIRPDLRAAKIPYRDASNRVADFHSLRYFYATILARSGVGLQSAQKLLRHSNPALTANIYTQIELDDLATDVAKIKKAG